MKPATAKLLGSFLVVLALVAAVMALVQSLQVRLLHRATATVRVERDESDLPELNLRMPASANVDYVLHTEAGLIPSEFILNPVIEKLDLNTIWGGRYNDGQKFKTEESREVLKTFLKASPVPGSALIQIDVTEGNSEEAVKIANAIAQSYCDYRVERRRRIAENAIKAIAEPFKSSEDKLAVASKNLEAARNALASDIRANPPQFPKGDSPELRGAQSRHNQALIQFIMRSNQLANATRSASSDAERIARTTDDLTRIQAELDAAATAVRAESQRLEALRTYWNAQENFENAEKMFAPFKKATDEARVVGSSSNKPPAVISDRAEKTATIEVREASRGAILFGLAGVLMLAGVGVLLSSRPPTIVKNQKNA